MTQVFVVNSLDATAPGVRIVGADEDVDAPRLFVRAPQSEVDTSRPRLPCGVGIGRALPCVGVAPVNRLRPRVADIGEVGASLSHVDAVVRR